MPSSPRPPIGGALLLAGHAGSSLIASQPQLLARCGDSVPAPWHHRGSARPRHRAPPPPCRVRPAPCGTRPPHPARDIAAFAPEPLIETLQPSADHRLTLCRRLFEIGDLLLDRGPPWCLGRRASQHLPEAFESLLALAFLAIRKVEVEARLGGTRIVLQRLAKGLPRLGQRSAPAVGHHQRLGIIGDHRRGTFAEPDGRRIAAAASSGRPICR